jgi:hypothetical protein
MPVDLNSPAKYIWVNINTSVLMDGLMKAFGLNSSTIGAGQIERANSFTQRLYYLVGTRPIRAGMGCEMHQARTGYLFHRGIEGQESYSQP